MAPPRTKPPPSPSQRSKCCVYFDRLISVIILLLVLSGFLYVRHEVRGFESRERAQQDRFENRERAQQDQIQQVAQILQGQTEVITKLNNSVTNSALMSEVHDVEERLIAAEAEMNDRLVGTQDFILGQLNATMAQLDSIVANAQETIHNEVGIVQNEVKQYVKTTQDQFSTENSFMIYQLAGTFTVIGCLISMWHMTDHLRNFNQPFVQRKILAILWMCPIYSITSWFSLVFVKLEGYLGIIKDFYEAYVIYQFLSFLIAVLGRGNRDNVVALLAKHANHLSPPARLFGPCRKPEVFESDHAKANAVLLQCQLFAMQFVFLKPFCAIALFVCDKLEWYGGGSNRNDWRAPQNYITFIVNVSVFFAFSGLLKFYHAVQDDLAWCRPFPKFLTIKGVVFMTFWQGMALSILAKTTEDFDSNSKDAQEWAAQSQCFLICLEMLGFSIAHFYCFPVFEWEEGYKRKETSNDLGKIMAFNDFFTDLKLVVRGSANRGSMKSKNDDALTNNQESKLFDLEEGKEEASSEEEVNQAMERLMKISQARLNIEPDDDKFDIANEEATEGDGAVETTPVMEARKRLTRMGVSSKVPSTRAAKNETGPNNEYASDNEQTTMGNIDHEDEECQETTSLLAKGSGQANKYGGANH
mmetsp:Transcript_45895/g.55690  ORF Transcript_45895/g.55690 Transcript_45895/m.55690 type:complete len:643 (-) Transcript_45895:308-2236(-)